MSNASQSHKGRRPEKPDQSIFQCGICQQRYRRADHLARHTRIHSHHKPHQCHLCGKSFSRSDLLKRHVASHTGPDGKLKGLPRDGAQPTSRVGQACRACAANHLRCTDSKPCKRCRDKGIECLWDQSLSEEERPAPSPRGADLVMQRDESHIANMDQPEVNNHEVYDQRRTPLSPESVNQPGAHTVGPGLLSTSTETYLGQTSSRAANVATANISPLAPNNILSSYEGFPLQDDPTRLPDWNFLPGQWQSPGDPNSIVDPFFPMMGLDEGDMRFLDVYNQYIPFELRTGQSVNSVEASTDIHKDTSPRHLASSGSEAFRHHHWRFRPEASRDHTSADEHNLSLPQVANDGSSPESRLSLIHRITAAPLSVYTRDSIVALVVKHCRSENLSRIFTSFPSAELLDKLCQYYLTSPIARPDTFLHVPSFNPNEKNPELLLAMVAAGAVLTSDPTLAKFGYAMHEIIRHAVAARWETNNALTRNLELLQAFLIHLEVGLWSGHSRKIEITESFVQVPVTILRRAGKFKKNEYASPPLLDRSMAVDELHHAWQSWLQGESWKRLAFRVLRHDTNSSTCLMVNPIVSYAEITLPLPCAPALWTAASAEGWVQARLQVESQTVGTPQPQNIIDLLDDPGLFGSHGFRTPRFDTLLASIAFLACAWTLAWECIQIRTIARSKPRRWSSLILSSRQDEVIKLLHNFRVSVESRGVEADDINLRLEHVLLHMHAPLDEIQVFAGMEGPEQAQAAHPIVKEWADSEAGRKAICHAGGIIRLILKMPRGLINGPLAFIMFHASIVLWTFSLVQSESTNYITGQGAQDVGAVWLDEVVETIALQRFVQLGVGKPYLKGIADPSQESPTAISLEEPQQLLGALVNILSRSHQGAPVPHLVDKMISLLNALQASS